MLIGVLFREELKATMRGVFAWLGAAVILLALGAVATVGTQDTWLDGYGIIAYFLVPLAFLPFAAGAIANPRVNRFVESVFTAPVERRDWFIAKVLVLFTLAAAYYLATFPMVLVYVSHVGMPLLLKKLLLWTPCLLLAGIAVGTLAGVLFIGRSIAPPAATGVGILLAYAGLVPLQELLVAQGNGATRTGSLTLASPAVLLKNGLGFTLATGSIPATTTMTWVSVLVVTIGAFALGAWVFLRAQGVETWETTRSQRWAIALGAAAIFLFPILFADRNYDAAAPRANGAPAIPGLFARGNGSLALAQPGRGFPARCCGTILNRDEPIGTDENTQKDLLILLPVEANQRVSDLSIRIAGGAGLQATVDPDALAEAEQHLETHRYVNDLGPPAADGHHVVTGWVARVPITLDPAKPWDIGGNRYPLSVSATYHVDGDAHANMLSARGAVSAQVGSAIYEMGAVSIVFPGLCLAAAIARWRRTR
jgi:ABC-type transport system involved in multi-copper enzyme maturation permease subunit